jgi:hypothetical protein
MVDESHMACMGGPWTGYGRFKIQTPNKKKLLKLKGK